MRFFMVLVSFFGSVLRIPSLTNTSQSVSCTILQSVNPAERFRTLLLDVEDIGVNHS